MILDRSLLGLHSANGYRSHGYIIHQPGHIRTVAWPGGGGGGASGHGPLAKKIYIATPHVPTCTTCRPIYICEENVLRKLLNLGSQDFELPCRPFFESGCLAFKFITRCFGLGPISWLNLGPIQWRSKGVGSGLPGWH